MKRILWIAYLSCLFCLNLAWGLPGMSYQECLNWANQKFGQHVNQNRDGTISAYGDGYEWRDSFLSNNECLDSTIIVQGEASKKYFISLLKSLNLKSIANDLAYAKEDTSSRAVFNDGTVKSQFQGNRHKYFYYKAYVQYQGWQTGLVIRFDYLKN